MKVKNKYKVFIVLTLFILVTTLCSINQVFGRGILSHAWIDESRGERKLLFREFTSPTPGNVEGYHNAYKEGGAIGSYTFNNGTYTSMWAYEYGNYVREPITGTFNTVGFAFHIGELGIYDVNNDYGTFGYAQLVNGASLDESIDSVNNAINNTVRVKISKPNEVNVGNSGLVNNSYYFYRILHNSYTESSTNSWNKSSYGTTLKTSMTASNLWASGRNTAYRYAVINRDNANIIISDWGLYGDQIQELKEAAATQNIGSGGIVWVSNILITRPWDGAVGFYELLKSSASFANAWESKERPRNWRYSKGLSDEKGLGSGINLFDNQIVLPVTDYRTVLVRHINVDTNTVISENIVNNATKIVESDNGIYYDGSTRSSNVWYGWDSYYYKYDKIAEVGKPVTVSALSPNANRKLSDGNTLLANGYYVLGYNIGQSTYSEDDARDIVNTKARDGSKETYWSPITINSSNTKDYVVVDFYYSTYAGDAEVNHVMLDSSNNIMESQDIESNSTAVLSNKKTINNLYKDSNSSYYNTSKKNSEIYRIPLKNTLTARKVSDKEYSKKGDNSYEYVGYSLSAPNTYVNPAMLNKGESTNISPNQTVTFYYRQIVEKIIEPEPAKTIGGSLSWDATGEDTLSTSCGDSQRDNQSVKSIPSGSSVRFGITDISKFMVGAITSKYIETKDQSLNVSVVLKRGNESSEPYNYSVKYSARYFVITDLLVYRLSNVELYDTGSGYDGTRGEKLFEWNDGSSNISPTGNTDVRKIFELYGRSGLIDQNNIKEISNYVSSTVYDKSGVKQTAGPNTITYTKTLLTLVQIAEVDADGNSVINEADRTYASNHLASLSNILSSAQTELNTRQTAYESAQAHFAILGQEYAEIGRIKDAKFTTYDSARGVSVSLYNSLNNKVTEYNEQLEIYNEADSNYQDKVNIYNEKVATLDGYEQDVVQSNAQLANLKAIYDDASDNLSDLDAELTNCKNVAIYEEDCKDLQTSKEDYFNNVYEVARLNYENYLNGENKNIIAIRDNYKANDVKTAKDVVELAYQNLLVEQSKLYIVEKTVDQANDLLNAYNKDYYIPAKDDYDTYVSDVFEPKEREYETFRDVTLPSREDAYNDYRDGDYATAETNYNNYNNYSTNLESKYQSYKVLYDDYSRYVNYTPNQLASELELKADISVQNMKVNMKDVDKNTSTTIISTEVKTETIPLSNIPSTPVFVEAQNGLLGSEEDQTKVNGIYGSIERNPLTLANYDNTFKIPESALNGVRALAAEATYVAEVAIGNNDTVEDNVYNKINSAEGTQKIFMVSKDKKIQKIYKEENVTQSGKSEVSPLNVYTPISVSASINTDSNKVVNQSNVDVTADQQTMQQNIPFTINFANEGVGSTHYKLTDTSKYSAGYYIKFDFDVENIKINGKTYNKGNKIPAGTWIGLIEGTSPKLTAQAYINTKVQSVSTISEDNASYTVRAVAYNATNRMRLSSTDFEVLSKMRDAKLNTTEDITNICLDTSYFAELKNNITLLNRMYDFKITDVKDVSWKSVFRKSTSQTTNKHTGTLYYAGISRWDTESEKVNSIVSRSSSEIGRNPLRIMPIGPYKNTNTSYVSAPKIGYRFSFDLKVTGSYSEDPESETNKKKVEITPSFYYISKDGKTFLSSYDGTASGIYLFYKNSSGKYVRLGSGSSDDNYRLSFIPNDGYRYITDANKSTLSNKTIELGTLNKITLTKEMSTLSANGSVRTYYGEYKLPNSTIAVKVDENGNYDLNKPLTNGYIGVVFGIDAIENDVVKLSYSKDTKGENTNTSQWEYEGYLGVKSGTKTSDISSTIQLEKGKWAIDGNTYSKIKGTAILYDLDQKAATDYE